MFMYLLEIRIRNKILLFHYAARLACFMTVDPQNFFKMFSEH